MLTGVPLIVQHGGALGLYTCHNGGGNQQWMLNGENELRHDVRAHSDVNSFLTKKEMCVEAVAPGREAQLRVCSDEKVPSSQQWLLSEAGQVSDRSPVTSFHSNSNPKGVRYHLTAAEESILELVP